jgi:hypothetical protein
MKKIYFLITFFALIGILPITGKAFDSDKNSILSSKEEISIQIDKKDVSGENKSDGYIKLKITGGNGPFKISFFSPYALPSHTKGDKLSLENLKSGEYLLVVQDSFGETFTKEVKLEVK